MIKYYSTASSVIVLLVHSHLLLLGWQPIWRWIKCAADLSHRLIDICSRNFDPVCFRSSVEKKGGKIRTSFAKEQSSNKKVKSNSSTTATNQIDTFSLLLFFISYLLFNIIYWIYCLLRWKSRNQCHFERKFKLRFVMKPYPNISK